MTEPASATRPSRSPASRSAASPSGASRGASPRGRGGRPAATSDRPAPAASPAADDSWTAAELAEVHAELEDQAHDLRGQIATAEASWTALQRDGSGEGAGDDQADAGSKAFEREHQLSLANNSRDLLAQVQRALGRLDDGTYGVCESCGRPIAKARLQAFPRATLCVACKQREERR